MNPVTSRRLLLVAGAALIAPQARAADEYLYPDFDRPSDWTRNFRVGMQIGLNIKAKFTTTGSFSVGNSGAGPNGFTFDNGYVLKDISGDPDGRTWNWGYDNPSQYDSGAQVINFQSTSSYDFGSAANTTINDQPYIGFDMGYGWSFARWGNARVGAELGVGILPINISDKRTLPATLTSQSATLPVDVIIPAGGYHGSFEGPGVTVTDQPNLADAVPVSGEVAGSRTLDVTLYSLRLGPTLFWDLSPKIGVGLSAGGAFGIVSGDYRFSERPVGSTGAFNTGSFGKTDPVFGAYVSGIATYRIEEHGDLYLGVQFMSMSDSTFRQGGREAKLGLGSAFYITAGVNWPF